jgi:hypothetical protein
LSRLPIHSKGEVLDPHVEFITGNGGGAGVRLRKVRAPEAERPQ